MYFCSLKWTKCYTSSEGVAGTDKTIESANEEIPEIINRHIKYNNMKKITFVFVMTAMIIALSSCVNSSQRLGFNAQQAAFDMFLSTRNEQRFDLQNDIQKSEFMKQFELDLYNYVDSAKLFVNWIGEIKNISTKSIGEHSTQVSFTIQYVPERHRKVEFNCLYFVDNDSLEADHIYNTVKNISNGTTVYFDGFIRTTSHNTVKYRNGEPEDELNLPYPDYDFYIVEVGTVSRGDSLSANLKAAVECTYKLNESLKQNFLKKISDTEQKKQCNALAPEFKAIKAKLTQEEKLYINRLINALTQDYLYGDY